MIIVGGGISGLAAAVRLASEREPLRLTMIEAADRLGGLIATERTDGFVIEHGPDAVLAAKPAAVELAQRVGVADRLISMSARGSFVVTRGELTRLPEGVSGLVPSRASALVSTRLLSTAGKARVLLEPFVRRHALGDDESIAAFVTRRFGREAYEQIAEPLLTGIFAGDGARLSLDATFPRLRALEREHGSVLRGMVAERHAGRASEGSRVGASRAHPSPFVSFKHGMAELPEGIARWLAGRSGPHTIDIRMQARVLTVLAPKGSTGRVRFVLEDGSHCEGDAIVLATPAAVSARLLTPHNAVLGDLLGGIEHASSAAVSLGYPLAQVGRPLNASGYTVPRVERRAAIACTWSSAKFAGRAPAHCALFRVFFGGVGREAVLAHDDADLITLARRELAETTAVRGEPVMTRVTRWAASLPQYTVGHLRRCAAVEERLALTPWLALAGNALHGIGIPDCIRSGERAATRILEWVAARAPGRVRTDHEQFPSPSYQTATIEQHNA